MVHQQQCVFTDYIKEVTTTLQAADPDLYHVNSDMCKHGTFLVKIWWNKAVKEISIATARQAVASPSDEEQYLQVLLNTIFQWLNGICIVLPNLDITYLHWINTLKGEIINAPFCVPVTEMYIVESHWLLDDTFEPASTIVPNLSCLQFYIRAMGAYEGYVHILNEELEGSLLDFYLKTLQPMLTKGNRYPFIMLREECMSPTYPTLIFTRWPPRPSLNSK
ncbi:hypothetical protein C8R48DRAFT_673994 [Suillus tomentosus]|nr:hypothetical protein C8R48DRAFT_673994 [Suillus tomentosus]